MAAGRPEVVLACNRQSRDTDVKDAELARLATFADFRYIELG